jgi:CRISPR-associated protein Csx10
MAIEMALRLRLISPLALHRTRASVQYVEALDYIPGTAVRGALAEAYLAQHGQTDEVFEALFLSEQVWYGDLWPTIQDGRTILIPASAQACKRHGLQHESSFRDSLLDALTSHLADGKCPHPQCEEPLDKAGGGYMWDIEAVIRLKPRSRLRVSTAIERGTGTIAREMLFTQHTLTGSLKDNPKRDLLFQGTLRLDDATLPGKLYPLLKAGTRLFFGSGRSRGLGEVEVEAWQETAPDDSLLERWQKFNEKAQRAGGDPDRRYFSLTLLSHLALRDDLLRPVLGQIGPLHFRLPDGVEWMRYPDSGQPVYFVDRVVVAGWNAAMGLPKPDTVALPRGSVLLFSCASSQEQTVLARLKEIEAEGVGERRGEGFGQVAVCYQIHWKCWEGR